MAGFLFPMLLAAAAPSAPLMLSDGASLEHWRAGVVLIADARAGRPAIRYAVPRGGPAGPALDFSQVTTPLTADMQICFRFRFTGEGSSSLHVKLIDPQYSQGWQATWQIEPALHPCDGVWRQASVDLGSEWMQWGDKPVTQGRTLNFRTGGSPDSSLTLDLADVALLPKRFAAKLKESRSRDGRGEAVVTLRNLGAEALPLRLRSGDHREELQLAGGTEAEVTVPVSFDPARWAAAQPLETVEAVLTVSAAGTDLDAREFPLRAAKPLALPSHPRLLIRADEVPSLKDRSRRLDWAQAVFEAEKKRADDWLNRTVTLPPRGSQWWHWYACKKDGGRLQTVSATEHKCPVCAHVYTGWPYDDVVLDREHGALANGLRTLGLLYQLTGEAAYAAKAKEILLAYAARYTSYPLHNIHGKEAIGGARVGPQTLDESTWLIPMCQGADMVWDTLTSEERRQAETGLFRPAAEVIRQHRMGIHNIQCWKNSAVGLVGLLLDDPELIADAVASAHGFHEQIARGVNADGQWYEGAWGYHFYTVSALLPLLEAGERCGLGLYAFERNGRSARLLFEGPFDLAMPNLLLPAFNDSGTVNLKGQSRTYEYALARYGNPRFAQVIHPERKSLDALLIGVETLPTAPAEARGSRNLPASGYAILEQGPLPQAAWLCLKYGPHGGGHGHDDKLNLLAYRNGVVLGLDPGTAAYGVPLQREWFRATIAHNTLTVDEGNQRPAEGTCLAFGADPAAGLSAVLAEAGPIYPGLTYRRAVALCGETLVLILDLVTADTEHTFDLAWHNAGRWATAPAGVPVELPDKPGYMHLRDTVRAEGALPVIQAGKDLRVGLAVASAVGETWAGRGFSAKDEDRPVAVIRRSHGRTAVVAWALDLGGTPPALRVEGTPEEAFLEVHLEGQAVRFTAAPGRAIPLTLRSAQHRLEVPAL
jgi:hypothetical protein